ncbi:MAG TPA: histone H1 [Casimicrobiaceae bacterium]|nr:histone H1 [Casimicrobiaceae bacterium]
MPKKDINQTAFDVVRRATGEVVDPPESAKAKAGRKGGQKGGASRADALTPEQRSEIAKKAAAARWRSKKG